MSGYCLIGWLVCYLIVMFILSAAHKWGWFCMDDEWHED